MKSNSLRLRLNQVEVNSFCQNGIISEQINFPNGTFNYILKSAPIKLITVQIDSSSIEICLPDSDKEVWQKPDQVGFSHNIPLDKNQKLSVTIEKDFKCLDERDEDESDNYPNPKTL